MGNRPFVYESNTDKQRALEAQIRVGAEKAAFERGYSMREMNVGIAEVPERSNFDAAGALDRYYSLVALVEGGIDVEIGDLKMLVDYMNTSAESRSYFKTEIGKLNSFIAGYRKNASPVF